MSGWFFHLILNKELHEKVNYVENFKNKVEQVQISHTGLREANALEICKLVFLSVIPERSKKTVHKATNNSNDSKRYLKH
jgi:dihydroneopterin aldolase